MQTPADLRQIVMEALGDLDSKKLKQLLGPYEMELLVMKEESDS